MPRNSATSSGGIRAGSTAGSNSRRNVSSESKAWLGAVLQRVREGSAVNLQLLLADLRAEGHLVPAAEADMVDEVERSTEPEIDAEVDLGDEDEATIEAWDEASANLEGSACALGESRLESNRSALIDPGFELIVDGEVCRFHLPGWPGFESKTELGQRVLAELATRFIVLERVAAWLSEARKQFLASADPWDLGCNALKELRSGYAPVSPQSFLQITGISELARPEAFSRYTCDCFLVWPDATAPLSMLFDTRARQAWVANVLNQLADGQLSTDDLLRLRNVTKPRSKDKKRELLAASVDSLSFSDVLERATLLANVGCSEVLAQYADRITTKDHE